MIDAETKRRLNGQARTLEPMVRIGKNGITEPVVLQVRNLITKRKLVKVKFLRSFIEANDRKKAAEELAERTRSDLVGRVGFTVVLYRK